MQGEQFVKVYEQIPPVEAPQHPFEVATAQLDTASQALGEWVYSYLSQAPEADGSMSGVKEHLPGTDRSPSFNGDFKKYVEWFRENAGIVRGDINTAWREAKSAIDTVFESGEITGEVAAEYGRQTDIAKTEAYAKYNWHIIATAMAPMWKPIIDGTWPEPGPQNHDKYWWIHRAQENLALQSMYYVRRRHEAVQNEEYFQPSSGPVRGRNEGFGAELEDGQLLLKVVEEAMLENDRAREQDPTIPELDLTVIPAPPQFESSDFKRIAKEQGRENPKNPNADFLIINCRTHEVVGWQSKTHLQQKVVKGYDTDERIIMSGTIDIGNRVRIRIPNERGKGETESSFPWIGGLAVQKALEISTYGPDTVSQFQYLFGNSPQGFDKQGNYSHTVKPRRTHINSIALSKRMAREIATNNHFDTDWVTDIQQAAQRPEVIEALKRVGYTPKANGYFYAAA